MLTAIIDKSSLIEKQPSPQTEKAAQGGLIGGEAFRYKLKVDSQHNKINNSIADNQPKKRDADQSGVRVKKTIIENNFFNRSEIKVVRRKFGPEGVLAIIAAYFAMSGSKHGFLSRDEVLCEAEAQGVKKSDEWLDHCAEKDVNIITESDGKYTNSHVESDRNRYRLKLESDRNRQKNKRESRTNLDIDNDVDDLILKIKDTPVAFGLKRFGDFVRLSDITHQDFTMKCQQEGFDAKDRDEIIAELNRWFRKNPHAWRNEDHFYDLMSWPIKKHREHKSRVFKRSGTAQNGAQHPISQSKPRGF